MEMMPTLIFSPQGNDASAACRSWFSCWNTHPTVRLTYKQRSLLLALAGPGTQGKDTVQMEHLLKSGFLVHRWHHVRVLPCRRGRALWASLIYKGSNPVSMGSILMTCSNPKVPTSQFCNQVDYMGLRAIVLCPDSLSLSTIHWEIGPKFIHS